MIFGVVIRVIVAFCRRRGLRVPDPSRLRLRQPRFGLMNRSAEAIAKGADDYLRRRGSRRVG
jgi:hypothetical protein